MPPLRGFYYLLTLLSYSCFEQTPRNRRFGIPMSMVTSMAEETRTFATPEVLKKIACILPSGGENSKIWFRRD